MWLKFGLAPNKEIKRINEVARGKTNLTCIYCGGQLIAKKGDVKRHHFAHAGTTCKPVVKRQKYKSFPGLPYYDSFNVSLPGKDLERLKVLWREYGNQSIPIPRDLTDPRWKLKGLLQGTGGGLEFSDLGKIPMGALPLANFSRVQEPLMLQELEKYERQSERATKAGYSNANECRADLEIYRAQLRRILINQLYFLEIRIGRNTIYKIGVTARQIEKRILEIERDLKEHFSSPIINILGLWPHRGNVELYFKHRYKRFNCRIGKLTEYFQFSKVKPVLNDLFALEPKVCSKKELELIASPIHF
ncbi:MAG: GIY-YIG nuclease family protein [Oscillatoria sp. SIO1A7]|nr:GIY-YIG nuclease family protein [Oscillatoria sp. SIO1A7]